jgi:hypothetical protein
MLLYVKNKFRKKEEAGLIIHEARKHRDISFGEVPTDKNRT